MLSLSNDSFLLSKKAGTPPAFCIIIVNKALFCHHRASEVHIIPRIEVPAAALFALLAFLAGAALRLGRAGRAGRII